MYRFKAYPGELSYFISGNFMGICNFFWNLIRLYVKHVPLKDDQIGWTTEIQP